MLTATIAETLHAKDPRRFDQLIARFLEAGLVPRRSLSRQQQGRRGRKDPPSRHRPRARVVRLFGKWSAEPLKAAR